MKTLLHNWLKLMHSDCLEMFCVRLTQNLYTRNAIEDLKTRFSFPLLRRKEEQTGTARYLDIELFQNYRGNVLYRMTIHQTVEQTSTKNFVNWDFKRAIRCSKYNSWFYLEIGSARICWPTENAWQSRTVGGSKQYLFALKQMWSRIS